MIGPQWRERAWLDLAATIACALGLAVVMATLLGNFYYYINFGLGAIGYPYELDYGEGLVWQQMADLPNGRMYTSIHDYPYLVYHYTPLYHTVAVSLPPSQGLSAAAYPPQRPARPHAKGSRQQRN